MPQKLPGGQRFQPADFSIGRYAARVPAGTTLSDVLHPEYFQNHLSFLRPGMEVIVLSDDFSLDAKIRILTVFKTYATTRVLTVYAKPDEAGEEAKPAAVSEVKVKFAGPKHNWRFEHGGQVIEFGFMSQEDAQKAADKYLETLKG